MKVDRLDASGTPSLGLHVSVRNGFVPALRYAAAHGCATVQVFARHPRRWRGPAPEAATIAEFRRVRERLRLHPLVIHSAYVPNLASSREDFHRRSIDHLAEELRRAEALGADEFVLHAGAASSGASIPEAIGRFGSALHEACAGAPGRVSILLENVSGGGRRLGSTCQEIEGLLNAIPSARRPGLCFDTGHAWGAGWDLSTPEGIDQSLTVLDRAVGLSAIRVFHVNDSAAPRGSGMDWHDHLGRGHIGLKNMRTLFARAGRPRAAYILETPRDAPGADAENLKALRSIIGLA